GANLGASVAGAGDVNGDGFADVIVGAPFYTTGQAFQEGAAFVFLGSASGIVHNGNFADADSQLLWDLVGVQLGASVAGAGDVDGDGYADVIVGAPVADTAFVFHGSANGIVQNGNPTNADAQLESDQVGDFGRGVAGAGDVNGDGFADVIVGAP